MPANPTSVDTLEHLIAHEERIVGIPTDQPLTKAAIVRRHLQIGVLLGFLSLATVATLASAATGLRLFASVLALAFGGYALHEGRHLERLARLHRDECSIHLTVADSLLRSGALRGNRELLDLRVAVELGAGLLTTGLLTVVSAECAGLRLIGPSGETPLAAVCDPGEVGIWLDPSAAHEALERREPVRRAARDGRMVIAAPLEHEGTVVAVLEVISASCDRYGLTDELLVVAFARGAISGLLSGRSVEA